MVGAIRLTKQYDIRGQVCQHGYGNIAKMDLQNCGRSIR